MASVARASISGSGAPDELKATARDGNNQRFARTAFDVTFKNSGAPVATTPNATGPVAALDTTIPASSVVAWGGVGENRADNYYITEESEPAPLGSSLGWTQGRYSTPFTLGRSRRLGKATPTSSRCEAKAWSRHHASLVLM